MIPGTGGDVGFRTNSSMEPVARWWQTTRRRLARSVGMRPDAGLVHSSFRRLRHNRGIQLHDQVWGDHAATGAEVRSPIEVHLLRGVGVSRELSRRVCCG